MDSDDEKCGNCKYFKAVADYGPCKRHAPVAGADNNLSAHWPWVYQSDYCGDFDHVRGAGE